VIKEEVPKRSKEMERSDKTEESDTRRRSKPTDMAKGD